MDGEDFDEESYLERYSDVAQAVNRQQFPSGKAHYDLFGRSEGRSGVPMVIPEYFDLDPKSSFMTIPSPALVTTPPLVIDAHKIPNELQSMYASLWQLPQPAVDIECYCLRDVVVVGDGLVFDMAGRLLDKSRHQTSAAQIEQAADKVRKFIEGGADEAVPGTTLLCEKIGLFNYGHWLVEMAPIAFLFRERLESEWFLRVPVIDFVDDMSAVIRESIALLGIDATRTHLTATSLPQRYQRLALTFGFSHHGASYSPIASNAMDAMASKVPATKPRKIWVSRADMRRRMQDENAICDALEARGWLIVSPGKMSLRCQIALFKNAEVVAGVIGAGLTNLGFAKASTRVISFVPCRMPDIFFWKLSQMKGQDYTEVRCSQEHEHDGAFNWEGLLMMTKTEVLAKIDAILAS